MEEIAPHAHATPFIYTFKEGVSVKELLYENGRMVGICGSLANGTTFTERARIVIGADGRNSTVGKLVQAPRFDERDEATFAYWTYFSGLPLKHAVMEKRGRLCVVIVPTNFNASMTLLFGPKSWFPRFRAHATENYQRGISFVNPELAELVAGGHQEEQFYGIGDQRAFKRQCAGPGWLLVGDAACIKDQCTAIGMTHAFRDAELAADAICSWFAGTSDEQNALGAYVRNHEADLAGYYDFVTRSAGMALGTVQDLQFMRGLQQNTAYADAFAAMYGDSLPVEEFLAEVRPKVLANAPTAVEEPSVDGLEALVSAS